MAGWRRKMTLKVMTWNVENLFQAGAPFGPKTQAVYYEKLDGLASVINAEAPHALGVQEIGDPNALDDLEQRLNAPVSPACFLVSKIYLDRLRWSCDPAD